ncbi:M1 family metallopeptidase [Halorhodospira halophila]|uniref:Peptidase M1, membrane alanine aminopeptidase n=1 Tax=Halorhodospira halophila (strain DSM 244 / SL1) TaxID=349124 RepID=A1WWZ6_HALHL|nr:peptidase M1, membrane alanine aminopeptidase [Halorhodospira halophila]ABM62208.1 peptidase M1, membrane alanine aminopeptidase [Halorhodospira halophila SL1]MBK1729183.1 hypothetical protein [Halorhodospira halophila]
MRRPTRILAALLLAALPAAAVAAWPDTPQAEMDVRLHPEDGRLEGRMALRLPDEEPLSLAVGPGFRIDQTELTAGRVETLGQRGVILHPDEATEARLRWSGEPDGQGRGSHLHTEGAWLEAAAGWHPRPASRRMGYRLIIAVPEPLQVVAEGTRAEEQSEDGLRRVEFHHPAPALGIALFAGEWQHRTREARHGTVHTFFPETLAEHHETYLERTAAYLDEYSEWIGPPPHETFSVLATPYPVGLAFAGFTALGEQVIPLPFIPDTSLPHEVVHNWWGRGVYTDYDDGNWNEALTYYMGDYHQALQRDIDEARRLRGDWLRSQAALPEVADYPLGEFRHNRGSADEIVGYQRGASLFHTLHRTLGEAGFDEAIRRFYEQQVHREAGWPDLEATFSDAAEADDAETETIQALFRWFLSATELPDLEMDERTLTVARDGDDRYRVEVEIDWDEEGYPVSIPVALKGDEGRLNEQEIHLQPGERTRIELASETRPRYLQADPDQHVYRQLALGEGVAILRDTLLAESVTLVSAWEDLEATANQALRGDVEPGEPDRDRPLLIVAPREAVGEHLEAAQSCITERIRPVDHDTVAWASTTGGGQPLIVLAAKDREQARQALQRLARYGRHSYVGFGSARGDAETGLYEPADRHGLRLPLADQFDGD